MTAAARVGAAILAAALPLLAAAPALAQGCALCRQNLEQNGGEGLVRGFFWSIVLLVSLPLVLAGTFLLLLRKAGRKAAAGAYPTFTTSAMAVSPAAQPEKRP